MATLSDVFPFGGVGVMLLGAAVSGAILALGAAAARRRLGLVSAIAFAGLLWSLVVIGLVTLIPAYGDPGIVPAEGRLAYCARDIGGPAPEGFWVFHSGQRLLNTALFVPAGAFLVLTAARWRAQALLLVPVGLGVLAAYSAGIEWTQLELARLDRACDLTDVVDNVTGAAIGIVIGIPLALLLRPWPRRR